MPSWPKGQASTPSGAERALADRSCDGAATTSLWARLAGAAMLTGCLGIGVGASLHAMTAPHANDLTTPHAGACVALELAMAHGYLDDTKKRIVMRTLVDPRNPYADRFGTSHAALVRTCARVYEKRWSP